MAEIQMPKGAVARERMELIFSRLSALEERVARLEAEQGPSGDREKELLVKRAHELKIESPSTLRKWSSDRLRREIAEAESSGE